MTKTINFNQTVYELIQKYPEIQSIMLELGFKDLKNPALIQTVGRYVTIFKGAKMKKIPLEKIKASFEAHGFIVEGEING